MLCVAGPLVGSSAGPLVRWSALNEAQAEPKGVLNPDNLLNPTCTHPNEVKAITGKVIDMAKGDAVEVEFSSGERAATRFPHAQHPR
jgi:hypothetical protein